MMAPQQITLDAALADKARVLDIVSMNNQSFVNTMRGIAERLATVNSQVTSDDLRLLAEQYGLKPDHQNAWGSIFHGKQWVVLDRRPSLYKGNRGREIKVFGLR